MTRGLYNNCSLTQRLSEQLSDSTILNFNPSHRTPYLRFNLDAVRLAKINFRDIGSHRQSLLQKQTLQHYHNQNVHL